MNIFESMTNVRFLLLLAACAAACTKDKLAPLVATDITVTQAAPGATMRAGYLTLTNNSAETISLTSVSSPQFAVVEIHETTVEDDIARMRRIETLDIEPGRSAKFERGGKHLMLMQAQKLMNQDSIDVITLNFYADELLVLSVSTVPDSG